MVVCLVRRQGILPRVTMEQRYLKVIAGASGAPLHTLARGMLGIAELPYSAIMRLRNAAYDSGTKPAHELGRPTISVGNITAGGTGKTPVVAWLAEMLETAGITPAVLMRGYRKSRAVHSDEQMLLGSQLPRVIVEANPNRVEGAAAAITRDDTIGCFVLDDGFQHRRVRRQFDLVLINATEPFGFGHVHPRGLLREPLSGLSRASAMLITHASEVPPETLLKTQEQIRRFTRAPMFHCDHLNAEIAGSGGETRELSDLAMIPFMLFTGIGHPQPLANSLRRFASAYKGERFYDDHHHYVNADVAALVADAQACGAKALLTTEKDWVKLQSLWQASPIGVPLYRLRLCIRFWENEEHSLAALIRTAIGA